MRGLCRLLLRDPAEAEDATQQAFLSAYRALLRGTEPDDPAAWVATIARNDCRARIRRRMRTPLVSADFAVPEAVDQAIDRLDMDALWTAIADLPRRQRKAFLLREVGGLSYDELALVLGVTGPAVESLLVRARSRLRSALASLASVAPTLDRLTSWQEPSKVAAAGVGISLVAGGSVVALPRGEGGPARRDAQPIRVVHHAHQAPREIDRRPVAEPHVAPVRTAAVAPVAARTPEPRPTASRAGGHEGRHERGKRPPGSRSQHVEREHSGSSPTSGPSPSVTESAVTEVETTPSVQAAEPVLQTTTTVQAPDGHGGTGVGPGSDDGGSHGDDGSSHGGDGSSGSHDGGSSSYR